MTEQTYFLKDMLPARPMRPKSVSISRNERSVLDLIRRKGGISRADAARELELDWEAIVTAAAGMGWRRMQGLPARVAELSRLRASTPDRLTAGAVN